MERTIPRTKGFTDGGMFANLHQRKIPHRFFSRDFNCSFFFSFFVLQRLYTCILDAHKARNQYR